MILICSSKIPGASSINGSPESNPGLESLSPDADTLMNMLDGMDSGEIKSEPPYKGLPRAQTNLKLGTRSYTLPPSSGDTEGRSRKTASRSEEPPRFRKFGELEKEWPQDPTISESDLKKYMEED
jgi:hypothetical protein